MFNTNFQRIENAFLLTVQYKIFLKVWSFRYYEELVVVRARLENMFVEGDTDDLREEMV